MSDYVTTAQVKARLSAAVVAQIYDDNNDGTEDTDPIARLTADATAWVKSWVYPIYQANMPFLEPFEPEIVRTALDAVEWMAAKRHPEYVRRNWVELKESNRQDLIDLRNRLRAIGSNPSGTPPEPAANEGGHIRSGDPLLPTVKEKWFSDGTGLF